MIDHPTVKAKQEYEEMIVKASHVPMSYKIIAGKQAAAGTFNRDILN